MITRVSVDLFFKERNLMKFFKVQKLISNFRSYYHDVITREVTTQQELLLSLNFCQKVIQTSVIVNVCIVTG